MSARNRRRILIVDGYNVINAYRANLDAKSLSDARDQLASRLQDYAGFSGQEIVLVYDAWMSDRLTRTEEKNGPVTVVYTQKSETADHYIERFCDNLSRDIEYGRVEIRVATSDNVEQTVVLGRGATRLSSRELLGEMDRVRREGRERIEPRSRKNTILDRLPEDIRKKLEDMRRR